MSEPINKMDGRPQLFWRTNESGEKPTSTSLHPEFASILAGAPPGIYLDVGCGSGRIAYEIPRKHHVVGVDINQDQLQGAIQKNKEHVSFVRASGEALPLADGSVDGAMLLGVLSTLDKEDRERLFRDTVRVTRKGGHIYIAEFSFIDDPRAVATTGKKWSDIYREDAEITGEFGTVIPKNPDGTPKFYAHHFTEEELGSTLEQNNVRLIACEKVQVRSTLSNQLRDNWNIWGEKQ